MVFAVRAHRQAVYSQLFAVGVMVVKKDYYGQYSIPQKSKDEEWELIIPNYEVMGIMKSLKDQGIVKETFNWGWHYYFLANETKSIKTTNDTIVYTGRDRMREILGLPESVMPKTHRPPEEEPVPERKFDKSQSRGVRNQYKKEE